ncbi:unnamed protein product [Rhodiola kirilowii]
MREEEGLHEGGRTHHARGVKRKASTRDVGSIHARGGTRKRKRKKKIGGTETRTQSVRKRVSLSVSECVILAALVSG